MKLSISTDILKENGLTIGEFLVLLMGYFEDDCEKCYNELLNKGLIYPSIYRKMGIVMTDKTNKLVENILTLSDDRLLRCSIKDFNALALKLQEIYPSGYKPGTTYVWKGTTEEVAQNLRALVVFHNFSFTEEEAINAVKEYVDSCKTLDSKYMSLLPFFILKGISDKKDKNYWEIDSLFMSIIENNRNENSN